MGWDFECESGKILMCDKEGSVCERLRVFIMNEKLRGMLCQLVNSVIFAGGIVFFIGLYYWIVKAGIPYQDPPLELQIQYAVNLTIGETLLSAGFWIMVVSGVVRVVLGVLRKKPQKV